MSYPDLTSKTPEVAALQDAFLKSLSRELKRLARRTREAGLDDLAEQIERVG